MTISSDAIRSAGPYTGNGITTSFAFSFKVFSKYELEVVKYDSANVEYPLTVDSDYTVTLNADQNVAPGGTVNINPALTSVYQLLIVSDVDYLQSLDLTNAGGYYLTSLTNALDKLTILAQQIRDTTARTLRGAITTLSSIDLTFPPPSASKVIGWNANGDGLTNYNLTASGTAPSLQSDLASTLSVALGDAMIGVRQHRGNAEGIDLDDWIEGINVSLVGTGLTYPADSTGVVNASTIINQALSDLPTEGGVVRIKRGTYKLNEPLRVVRRNTRIEFEDATSTILILTLTGANRGGWVTTTAYAVGDIAQAPAGNPYNGLPIYYLCRTAHTSGTFAADLAAGKWELWCLISLRAQSCEVERGVITCAAGVVGIASEGVHDSGVDKGVYFTATGADSGIGLLLSSYDYTGLLAPGAYPHRIGKCKMNENYGVILHPGCYLYRGVEAIGDQNGCTLDGLSIMSLRCIEWAGGGGNSICNSLLQSPTGAVISGSGNQRPVTGGQGIGIYHAGTFFVGNGVYFERFEFDTRTTGAPGAKTIWAGSTTDASNNVFSTNTGSVHPPFCVTDNGVGAFVIDNLVDVFPVNSNGTVIPTDLYGRRISGNGAVRTSCTIGVQTGAVVDGRVFVVAADSWPIEIIEGTTGYFGSYGSKIIIGQAGILVNGVKTFCRAIRFIYLNGLWNIDAVIPWSYGGRTYATQTFSANAQTLTITAQVLDVDGGGANRTACLIAAPRGHGDEIEIVSQSLNTVAFAAGTATWAAAGAPTLGVNAGNTMSVTLTANSAGVWQEKCRAIK